MATRTPVTPLYAIAGAGDLAVEKFRSVSEDVTTRFAKLDQKTLQSSLQTELTKRQAELSKRLEVLAAEARTVPAKLRELPSVAQAGLTTVLGQAEETYEDLAGRGKDLVTRIRSQ
ncbi:MAG: heparin binding hemagglutinin HbhA [Kribbellaceae bacterium]|nr:heparin binding hemagglutinin HbhA [Kribbellaceae bacterium]